MPKPSIIRSLYFYVIAIIGLMMVVFSTADLINLGLKTWVFPNADDNNFGYACPLVAPAPAPDGVKAPPVDVRKQCLEDQKTAKDRQVLQRESNAVRDLSFLIVGIPLFLFHFRVVQKERKEEKQSQTIV